MLIHRAFLSPGLDHARSFVMRVTVTCSATAAPSLLDAEGAKNEAESAAVVLGRFAYVITDKVPAGPPDEAAGAVLRGKRVLRPPN
jgi:hypothetical protein